MASSEERLVFEIFARDRGASRTFDQVGRSADRAADDIDGVGKSAGKAGDDLSGLEKDAKHLDRQLDDTRRRLKDLVREFDKTGDVELLPRIGKDRSKIALLESLKRQLPQASDFFSDFLSSGAIRGPAAAIGVQVASAVAAPLAAGIAGAVVGAVGLGGIVGGIALAAQDPRVKSEGAKLGHEFMGELKDAASPFVGPLLSEFGELREVGASFAADLHTGFAKLAPVVKPLVEGIRGFATNLHIDKMFEAAEPAVRALANELPALATSFSDLIETLAEDDRATEGLVGLLHVTEDLIDAVGFLLGSLEYEYDSLVKLGTKLDEFKESTIGSFVTAGFGGGFDYLTDSAADITEATDKANDSTKDYRNTLVGFGGSMYDVAEAAKVAADRLKDLNDGIEDYLGKTLGVEEAQIRLKEQWADTVEVLTEGKRTLNLNTEAGRENEKALIDMIRAADNVRDAEFRKTGSLDAANAAYDRQLEKLRDLAVKLGFDKTRVDELINSVKTGNALGGLKVPVTMPGLDRYIERLNYFTALLGAVKGANYTEFVTHREGERNPNKRAAAGPLLAGNDYIVGDNGPEILHMGANASMSGATATRAALGGMGGGVNIYFPGPTGDPIFDAVLRMMREGVAVQGGDSNAVTVYFGGVPV